MPRPSTSDLHSALVSALSPYVISHSNLAVKPFLLDLKLPLPHRTRVYMYNATHPAGGRTLGEHKVQLIVPGQRPSERASFDHSGGRIVLLIGYAQDSAVFILWDAGLYPEFGYSRNVQVKPETVYAAVAGKIGVQDRSLWEGKETVITANAAMLPEALQMRVDLTRKRLAEDL